MHLPRLTPEGRESALPCRQGGLTVLSGLSLQLVVEFWLFAHQLCHVAAMLGQVGQLFGKLRTRIEINISGLMMAHIIRVECGLLLITHILLVTKTKLDPFREVLYSGSQASGGIGRHSLCRKKKNKA